MKFPWTKPKPLRPGPVRCGLPLDFVADIRNLEPGRTLKYRIHSDGTEFVVLHLSDFEYVMELAGLHSVYLEKIDP